ncbi:MAG: hypothetical protein AB7E53_00575 [Macellibacteroides sp.]|uniref:hypothetical protein n=1 Tax=Macellibacteroides sp. TaxID=2014584 RepID=UPI003E79D212
MWKYLFSVIESIPSLCKIIGYCKSNIENKKAIIIGYTFDEKKYYISNVGKAIAYNVRVEMPEDCKYSNFIELNPSVLPLEYVNPGDEIPIYIICNSKDSKINFSIKFIWDDKYGKDRSRDQIFSI